MNIYIKKVMKSCSYLIPLFYRLRKVVPINILVMVFNALCVSRVKYCIICYGANFKTTLKPINNMMRKLIRIMYFKADRDSLVDVLRNESFLDIYQLHAYALLRHFVQIYYFDHKNIINLNMVVANRSVNYDLRRVKRGRWEVPRFCNFYGRFRICNRLVILINFCENLNFDVVSQVSRSLATWSYYIKKFLRDVNCTEIRDFY